MDRSEAKMAIIVALASGLCRADDLAATIRRSARTVYRLVADLRKEGHRIRGEAGVGYVLDIKKPRQ